MIKTTQSLTSMMNLNHKVRERPVANGLRVVGLISLLCIQSIFFAGEAGAQSMGGDRFEKTLEEARVPAFKLAEPGIAQQLTSVGERFSEKIATIEDPAALRQLALVAGLNLWEQARQRFQAGAVPDDRPLYWQRLVVAPMIRARAKQLGFKPLVIAGVISAFEQASRGQMDVLWTAPNARRVLITGFDPFSLDKNISQSNPSGAVALALDGQVFEVDGVMVEINAAVFPVRYPDFDAGVVERWLTPHLSSGGLDLFVSVSMGRDQFDLERFPGRRRSSSALGNLQEHTGGTAASPKPGLLDGKPLQGPEFVEFSLPAAVMQQAQGEFEIRDNHRVSTLEGGAFEAVNLAALQGQTAVQGSGGGYLSNEISYRSIRLANELGVALPMGHIHTPRISGEDLDKRLGILAQIKEMILLAALEGPG